MAFKVMRVELINCPVNYEDPEVDMDKDKTKRPVAALKTVTWKSIVTTPFKTPQECVGHNRMSRTKSGKDRCLGRTMYPCGTLRTAGLGSREATG
jgi:hypothetical protein